VIFDKGMKLFFFNFACDSAILGLRSFLLLIPGRFRSCFSCAVT